MAFNANFSISQTADQVRGRAPAGYAGQVDDSSHQNIVRTFCNFKGQAVNVDTVQIAAGAPSSGDIYSFVYAVDAGGVTRTFTYVADGTEGSASGVASAFLAQLQGDPLFGAFATATVSTDTLTLTGRTPSAVYTISSGTNTTAARTQTAASAQTIEFGRLVAYSLDASNQIAVDELTGQKCIQKPDAADFTAQSDAYQITSSVASDLIVISVIYQGATYPASVVASGTPATDATALAAALTGVLPSGLTPSAATDTVTIVADVAGDDFTSSVSITGTSTVARTSNKGLTTSVIQRLAGIAKISYNNPSQVVGQSVGAYIGTQGVRALQEGRIWVLNSELPNPQAAVYLSVATADAGQLYTSAGANRILLPSNLIEWSGNDLPETFGVAKIAIRFQQIFL